MKKIFASIIAFALSAVLLAAQDINQATDLYNNGAAALSNGEKTTALEAIESLPCELPTATYNLAGQRTSDSSHGLLIQSGHKRIVK